MGRGSCTLSRNLGFFSAEVSQGSGDGIPPAGSRGRVPVGDLGTKFRRS